MAVLAKADRPMYGYLIAKQLERVGEGCSAAKQSALYPVLRNLEGAGLLDSYVEPSMSGPPRRYYRITDAGRTTLHEWVTAWRAAACSSIPSCWGYLNERHYLAHHHPRIPGATAGRPAWRRPAMIQDALYDAEEYLRSGTYRTGRQAGGNHCLSRRRLWRAGRSCEIYRDTEVTVNRACVRRPPPSASRCGASSSG